MSRVDSYPSRVGGLPQVLPRKDPVVYARTPGGPGSSSPPDLVTFERDGCLGLEGFLPPEHVDELRGESEHLRRRFSRLDRPEVVREPDSGDVRSVFAIHRTSRTFERLVRDPRLLTLAEDILGGPVYLHQSRINYKPAFRGREFYWHSDFETWHVEDGMAGMRALSICLNLLENHAHNGPLMLIPGSHREFVACAGRTPEKHYETSLQRQEYGVPDPQILSSLARRGGIVAPTGPPGSIVVFDCNAMHGSNGNITPFARTNVFLVYNSVENALQAPFSGQPPRPEHIASRHVQPLAPAR